MSLELLVLRAGDEQVLREWTRASSIPAGLAQRARIVLLAAEGQSNTEIGRLVGVSLPTVRLWRGRYGAGGVEALGDLHRSGRPAIHDETSIIAATLEPPPTTLGVTHWSARLLADHLDISFAGSSDLCVVGPPGSVAGSGQEDAESVVVEGPEAVGQAPGLLDDQVDGLGAAVAHSAGLEVSQDLGAPGS